MQPDKVDFTVRWDRAELEALRSVAVNMGGMSTAALIRWVMRGWLERQRDVASAKGASERA